jgi:hypothetical protein
MACILQSGASTILSRDMAALPGEAEANASGVACACRHRVEEIASADVLTAGGGACDGARWRATSGATESLLRQVIAWRFVAWWVINDRGISEWTIKPRFGCTYLHSLHLHHPITFKHYTDSRQDTQLDSRCLFRQ